MVVRRQLVTRLGAWPRRLTHRIVNLLFPQRCVVCGQEGDFLCRSCHSRFPKLDFTNNNDLPNSASLEEVRSVWPMDESVRQLIHQFKYRGLRTLDSVIAMEMIALVREWALDVDGVVAVPLHAKRLRERGFDQAGLLARKLAAGIDRPVLSTLSRIRPTASQAQSSVRDERLRNMANAFTVNAPEQIRGKRLLLVDDVVTTGATLGAAAGALRKAGSGQIWGVTAAYEV